MTRSPACLGRPSLFDAGEGHEFDAYAVEDFDEGTWIEGDPYADDASAWDVGDADEDWEYCYADPYGEWEDY